MKRTLQFICMVVLLGLQTLLSGSWNMDESPSTPLKSDTGK